ncbi:cohesin subunit SA-3 [Amia ocellicauda]|uniref:cohesin subunit SA-3 n=1 Tax=Amia ocellicauda TaxID=2972642 RepID=UPI0034646DEF
MKAMRAGRQTSLGRRGSPLQNPSLSVRNQSGLDMSSPSSNGRAVALYSPAPFITLQSVLGEEPEDDGRDSEEWDELSESSSDFEAQMSQSSRKRAARSAARSGPAAKRPQRSTAQGSRATPPGAAATRSPANSMAPEPVTAGVLYEAVRSVKSAMRAVIDDWLDSYKHEKEAGLLELINFVVQCSGCKGVVSREMFARMQNAEIISWLTREFDEDSGSYPLSTPGPQWRKFRVNLCEFVRLLVRSCQHSLLYDEYLFNALISLLTGLSDSQVRAFRHTSTLIALKLMTALVEVGVSVAAQWETSQRQYGIELGKEPYRQAPARLEELRSSHAELLEHQEELSGMMTAIFRGIFVHRYRDTIPEIRALCMEEVGEWMLQDSQRFLNDGYLKYLGWTLHDKQGPVRLKCLKALQGVYSQRELTGRLELFTSRFKERMLSMVQDKECDVAMEAVRLVALLQQNTEDMLTDEDCARVYPLIYASHRGLASAAGAFLYNRLCIEVDREGRERELVSRRVAIVRVLLSFYIQTELHEHAAYLVDSLWDSAGAELKDWEMMSELLLEGPGEKDLADDEESALIELMVCALRQAAQHLPPVGRTSGKRVLSAKDKKTQTHDKLLLTSHFITVLPHLLAKYSADKDKVSSLLQVPLYFELQIYCTGRREKHLDLLLAQVAGIVEKHTDPGVLEACASVFAALCSERYTFAGRADVALGRLMEGLTDCFSPALEDLLQGTMDDVEMYNAAATLKRIAALYNAKDLTQWDMFKPCYQLLKSGVESGELDKEIMVPALRCAFLHVLWELTRAVTSEPTRAQVSQLRQHLRALCTAGQSCLSAAREIRDEAFLLLCDLLLLCSPQAVAGRGSLQAVVSPPSPALRSEMAGFILDYVFVESEEDLVDDEDEEAQVQRIEALHRRRVQLAGFCKLIVFSVLELSAATDVFKHYHKFYNDYGDIIRETLSKARAISRVQSARTVCLSLQQVFSELLQEQGSPLDTSSPQFCEIRDLARRLAMTFGIDLHLAREPLVTLHKDGIRFALRDPGAPGQPPPQLPFLEVLSEFSFKLIKQDRALLAGFLQRVAPSPLPSWTALAVYQRSLQSGPRDRAALDRTSSSAGATHTPAAKRRRAAKQATSSSPAAGVWLERSSNLSNKLPTPSLASTALRAPSRAPRDSPASGGDSERDFSHSPPPQRQSRTERQAAMPPPSSRGALPSPQRSPDPSADLDSQLYLLSLIEEDEDAAPEEAEIEDFESSVESEDGTPAERLPSTRHQRHGGLLQDLFD